MADYPRIITAEIVPGGGLRQVNREPSFTGKDICPTCGKGILEEHIRMNFQTRPEEHTVPYDTAGGIDTCVSAEPEWRQEPGRVAFNRAGVGPIVMIHEGADEGDWVPCSTYTPYDERSLTKGDVAWLCRRLGPADPCDEDFLRSISS